MDKGHTYGTPAGLSITLYAEPSYTPPELIEMTVDGAVVRFARLAPPSLVCDDVPGVKGHCANADCHRTPLGGCQCGRHKGRQPFVRAVR